VKLRFTLLALSDLDEILAYIAARSPIGAERVKARIKTLTELLVHFPRIGTLTDDPAIRRLTTSPYPYLIFYEVTDAEVIVHAVRHGSRDPSGMPGPA
jgi:plasmid stabilization system protein ParE